MFASWRAVPLAASADPTHGERWLRAYLVGPRRIVDVDRHLRYKHDEPATEHTDIRVVVGGLHPDVELVDQIRSVLLGHGIDPLAVYRSMSTLSAKDRVLLTPELLENILCLTDVKTLLISAQRVSRTWHEVAQAPCVQWALFLAPDCRRSMFYRYNPLLMEIFPLFFEHLYLEPHQPLPLTATTTDTATLGSRDFPSIEHILAKREAFARPDASWRRMLPRQPPLHGVSAILTGQNDNMAALMGGSFWDEEKLAAMQRDRSHPYPTFNDFAHKLLRRVTTTSDVNITAAFRVIWHRVPPDVESQDVRRDYWEFVARAEALIHTATHIPLVFSEEHPNVVELRRILGKVSR
ncbi:hypothetical protein DL771_011731 [Monosporascus sp. 5C6A]|nr:hypothetical protein DL771_011731 [Monosporascus sp. 5C6A]